MVYDYLSEGCMAVAQRRDAIGRMKALNNAVEIARRDRLTSHNYYLQYAPLLAEWRRQVFDIAGIAQLVERNLAKVEVAGSNPVSRSKQPPAQPAGVFV